MIIVPVIFNSVQYWIQDNFIKADDKDLEGSNLDGIKEKLLSYEE